MDYHADRFRDFSLIAEDDGKLIAVLPANLNGAVLHSHEGLSYGGWVTDERMSVTTMCAIFDAMQSFLRRQEIARLVYKCVPRIYHRLPADEDLYCLFRMKASLFRRDLATVVDLSKDVGLSSQRKRNISRARKANLHVSETNRLADFHELLSTVLHVKHHVLPAHSLREMVMLKERFPERIRLFASFHGEKMLAGTLVFDAGLVAHTQYLANSDEGRRCGALDFLLNYVKTSVYQSHGYLSFGISTEHGGYELNEGLVAHKEGFGGRSIVHDWYSVEV
jgi:hypothetical protein